MVHLYMTLALLGLLSKPLDSILTICGWGYDVIPARKLSEEDSKIAFQLLNYTFNGTQIDSPKEISFSFDLQGTQSVTKEEVDKIIQSDRFKKDPLKEFIPAIQKVADARKAIFEKAKELESVVAKPPQEKLPLYMALAPQTKAYGEAQEVVKKLLIKHFSLKFEDNLVDCD